MTKTCKRCNEDKPVGEMAKHSTTGNPRSICLRCSADWQKEYRKNNKEKIKRQRLKAKYNLTDNELESFLAVENCQICGRKARLHLDHCHETGKYRGALCHGCNTSLGAFRDDVNILKNAIKYLNGVY